MIGNLSQDLAGPSSSTSLELQGTSHPRRLRSIPPSATLRQPSGNYHKGNEREDRQDIVRERSPEITQQTIRRQMSPAPETPPFQPQFVDPFDIHRNSHPTASSSTRNGSTRFGDGNGSHVYKVPAAGPVRVSPQDQPPEPHQILYYPSTSISLEAGETRENPFVGHTYDEAERMVDDRFGQIPAAGIQTEERRPEAIASRTAPRNPSADALTFQQHVLVTVRELCADAARGYWQTKRRRCRLMVNIPASRALRGREPYSQHMRRDIPPSRNFHDPQKALPWTREPGHRPFVYSDNLEGLISRISDQEWTQAMVKGHNWDSVGAHGERVTAVHRMSKLYHWIQIVLRAVEQVHVDQKLLSHSAMTDVMLAARDLAVWLLAYNEKKEIQQLWGEVIAVGVKPIEG